MEYSPKGETKQSDIVIIGLFALSVALFAVSSTALPYAWVTRLVGLFTISAAVYLAVRFRLTQFVYTVSGEAGDEVFTVYRDRGRNKIAECRVSMSYLRSVRRYADREAMKSDRAGLSVYDYVQSMTPRSLVLLVFESTGDKDLGVILECDEAFERALADFSLPKDPATNM